MNQTKTGDTLRHTKIQLNTKTGAIPALGFGTLIPDPVATRTATAAALKAGFRTFDTAERYRTEKEVGEALHEALREGYVRREDLFVMTKLWNTNHRPERAKQAFAASLERLGLDYIDLYLIHTPFAFKPGDDQDPRDESGAVIYDKETTLLETWHALEGIVDAGLCKAIGLSDCKLPTLQSVYESARIKPALVQLESHPYNPEWQILEYCNQNGIVMQAFAPLGHSLTPSLLEDSVVANIAKDVNKTAAQVLLAWALQRGTAVLTTSKTENRINENFDVSAIPQDAVDAISKIETRIRFNTVVETGVPGFIPRTK
jgi:diketogulonate reductase-like aldo/keto reductase